MTSLLQPMSKIIQQVTNFREVQRTSPFFNHLSAISESVPALGWVAMVSVCVCLWGGGHVCESWLETIPSLILSAQRRSVG